MKLNVPQSLAVVSDWTDLRRFSAQIFGAIADLFNGNVSLIDNCSTAIVSVDFNKANVDMVTPHSLGAVPKGYIVVGRSASFTIYDGLANNTPDKLFLRGSAVGTASVMVFL